MCTLNLINPAVSDINFTTLFFPDGQPHIKIDTVSCEIFNKNDELVIVSRISNANDLLMILLAKNTLSYLGFEQIGLKISYLMAARMDRVMLDGEPFSLKVIGSIINQAGFKKISIFDPHSEVATAVIEKAYSITNHQFIKEVLDHYKKNNAADDVKKFCLVSPDAGALKKIYKVAAALNGIDVVECMKERDLKTGALSGFKVFEEGLQQKICFIVDDICDGGGTFTGVAAELKKLGAEKIILVVSHGIFSKGFNLKNVDEMYCTDSYKAMNTKIENLNVFPVLNYL